MHQATLSPQSRSSEVALSAQALLVLGSKPGGLWISAYFGRRGVPPDLGAGQEVVLLGLDDDHARSSLSSRILQRLPQLCFSPNTPGASAHALGVLCQVY